VANLGNSKLKALTVLDDEDVEKLAEGEEVDGLGTADDIAKMSIRELRAALRKEKQERRDERASLEGVIAEKNRKANELESQLRYQQPPTKEELAKVRLDEMRKLLVGSLSVAKDNLQSAVNLVANAQEIEGVTVDQLDGWIQEAEWVTSLLSDTFHQLEEDMENIRPAKQED